MWSLINLIAYLLTYLLSLSQHYDGDVDVMCKLLFVYFPVCCIPYKSLQDYCSIYFILLHKKPIMCGKGNHCYRVISV